MFRWIPVAMTRVALFFAIGILLNLFFPVPFFNILFLILVLLFLFSLFLHYFKKYTTLKGMVVLCAISMAGYLLAASRREENKSHHFSDVQNTTAWIGRVVSYPEEKRKSWKLIVDMERAQTANWKKASGRVQLYISSFPPWKYGDRLLIRGSPSPILAPMNPGEFDLKKYLSFQNIFFRQYSNSNSIISLPRHEAKGVIYYSHRARHWASEIIKKYMPDKQAQGLCLALVLGVTDALDNDLKQSFAAVGTIHVLSVSGLHVGVILIVVLGLLRLFKKSKYYRWIGCIVCLIALWSFAFISGLSPSVLRAVTMFSFMSVGGVIGRNVYGFNVLAGSAFLLLIYNPFFIMRAGFQLSYLAMIGIFYSFNRLNKLFPVKNWLGNACREIICLSLSAQAATFLLGLVYFQQFPIYFLLSNLIAAPLAMGILIGGIALLAFSFTPLASALGFLLELICRLLIASVKVIEGLPLSPIANIHFTWLEFLFLSLAIIFIVLLFETKKWNWVYAFTLMIVLYSATRWVYFFQKITPSRLIVYSVPKDGAVQVIKHGKSTHWLDQKSRASPFVAANQASCGVKYFLDKKQCAVSQKNALLFSIKDYKIAWLTDAASFPSLHYLIIGRNAVKKLDELKKVSACVVLDGSNSFHYANQVKDFCRLHKIPFHSVAESGAFIIAK